MTINIYKNKIKCAVFDLDGTLLNTIKTINYYLNEALKKNGLGLISEDDCREFVGNGAVKLIERALNHLGADKTTYFEAVFTDYNAFYDADPYYLTEAYDGIWELLTELKQRSILLAVLSNKPDFATRSAVGRFFPETFDICYGAREGIALKPNPEALLSMLDDLGVSNTETAYIGDSEPDIKTAENANVALSVSVSWGFRSAERLSIAGASLIIDHPSKIMDIICAEEKD